jgi:hypothetical protein
MLMETKKPIPQIRLAVSVLERLFSDSLLIRMPAIMIIVPTAIHNSKETIGLIFMPSNLFGLKLMKNHNLFSGGEIANYS